MSSMRLRELLARSVAYDPDAVPVAIDPEARELMSQTGVALGLAGGASLLFTILSLTTPVAPLMLLWCLANLAALIVWWRLREDTAGFHLAMHNQLRSMGFLSQLAEFYRVGAQVGLYTAIGVVGVAVAAVGAALVLGFGGFIVAMLIIGGMAGGGR